jgi:hypothetical protein
VPRVVSFSETVTNCKIFRVEFSSVVITDICVVKLYTIPFIRNGDDEIDCGILNKTLSYD